MKAITIDIENKVDELLIVLDKDIQYIQHSLSWLEELRSLVIKRDDVALSNLLECIRSEADSHTGNELKRQSIRKDLANDLGCSVENMTLSKIETVLSEEKRIQVAKTKVKITEMIEQLKKELLSTTLLLSECARFNSLIIRSILNLGEAGTVMYSSKGTAKRHSNMNLVNIKF